MYVELMKLSNGQSFGELALITSKPRSANVMCLRDCHFAIMNKHDFERVLQKIELKAQILKYEFLTQIPFLKKWSKKQMQNFQYYLTTKEYPRGTVVFKEGDLIEYVAIVKSGEFIVTKRVPRTSDHEQDI